MSRMFPFRHGLLLIVAALVLFGVAAGAANSAKAPHPALKLVCRVTTGPFNQQTLKLSPQAARADIHNHFLDYRGACGAGRAKLALIVKIEPQSDSGQFNVFVNGRRLGHDFRAGSSPQPLLVLPGWNVLSEQAGDATSLDDYLVSWSCIDHDRAYNQSGQGSTARVFFTRRRVLNCTFTNTRRANVTIKKIVAPASDAGQFDFAVQGNSVGTGGNGFASAPVNVSQGSVVVSEAAHPGTDMSSYDSSYSCTDNGQPLASGAGFQLTLTAADGHSYVCTFTNSKKPATGGSNPTPPTPPAPTGTLELKKVVPAAGDQGKFNLIIDGQIVAQGGNGADSGPLTVTAGNHSFNESAQSGTDLGDYTYSSTCKDGDQTVYAQAQHFGSVAVAAGHTVVCTITNTPGQGSVDIVKMFKPTTDGGTVNLRLDGQIVKAHAANGDSSGPQTVAAGDHTVSESSDFSCGEGGCTGTFVSEYVTSYQCYDQHENLVAQGPGRSVTVHVHAGEQVTCTLTNNRGSGTVEIVKHLVPATSPDRFDLMLDGQTVYPCAGDGDSSGPVAVVSGSHSISEAIGECIIADNALQLSAPEKYTTTWSCVDVDSGALDSSGSGTQAPVFVNAGQALRCTFTNTADSQIDVMKALTPANDAGRFALDVDGLAYASNCGDGCGTLTQNSTAVLPPGTHTVSEAIDTQSPQGLALSDYMTTYSCLDGETVVASGSGSSVDITTTPAQHVVCTFSNQRKGYVVVSKTTVPENDPGTFNLQVNGQTVATGGNGTQSSPVAVPSGANAPSFTVGETGANGTDLGVYSSQTECIDSSTEAPYPANQDGSYPAPAPGQQIDCDITNTHNAVIEIKKSVVVTDGSLSPSPSDTWDFKINAATVGTGGDGFDSSSGVVPGQYTVSESPTAATAADEPYYTTHISCVEDSQEVGQISNSTSYGPFTVDAGEHYTCTFTNTFNHQPPIDPCLLNPAALGSIIIVPINVAPVAVDDAYATLENHPLSVTAPGVLGNDSDLNNDPLTAVLVSGPAHGTLTLNADGSFTYTPSDGYFGADSFTYEANDGTANSNVATATITISAVG